jgi:hypothetical protein
MHNIFMHWSQQPAWWPRGFTGLQQGDTATVSRVSRQMHHEHADYADKLSNGFIASMTASSFLPPGWLVGDAGSNTEA